MCRVGGRWGEFQKHPKFYQVGQVGFPSAAAKFFDELVKNAVFGHFG